jgi:hypothetical protein
MPLALASASARNTRRGVLDPPCVAITLAVIAAACVTEPWAALLVIEPAGAAAGLEEEGPVLPIANHLPASGGRGQDREPASVVITFADFIDDHFGIAVAVHVHDR